MRIRHNVHRLKLISKDLLLMFMWFKFRQWAHSVVDRFLYPAKGPLLSKKAAPLRPIRLFHLEAPDVERLRKVYPDETESIIIEADKAASRNLDDFWHLDPVSGHRWKSNDYFRDIKHSGIPGVDIKTPWELSRCQHFVALAQAYALTKNEKYAKVYFSQVMSWIERNPPKRGVNWACAMEVALRACNWLAAWDMFQSSPSMPAGFKDSFSVSLYEHGDHLFHYMEWAANISTNHYLSDLLGLFYIGVALNQKKWVAFAQNELGREIFHQTYDDGFDYEGSTTYHRLVFEIFFYFARVCERNPERTMVLGAVFLERLEMMRQVIEQLSAYDGTIPMIGDNDSGRVHVFLKRADNDMSFFVRSKALPFESVWLYGLAATDKQSPAKVTSKKPSQSGLLTLRGGSDFLVFCSAPNGTRGVGNHTHNDKLSFCLWANGEWFLVDPGSGSYTRDPALRNRLRSTAAHSTLMINGEEQNRIDPSQLFTLSDDARVSIDTTGTEGIVEAAHTGYERTGILHRRRIERKRPGAWTVTDFIEGTGQRKCNWFFQCDPSLSVEVMGFNALMKGKNGRLVLRSQEGGLQPRLLSGVFSPAYGVTVENKVISFECDVPLPARFSFDLEYIPS